MKGPKFDPIKEELRRFVKRQNLSFGISYNNLAKRIGCDQKTLRSFRDGGECEDDTINKIAGFFLDREKHPIKLEPGGELLYLVEAAFQLGHTLQEINEESIKERLSPRKYLANLQARVSEKLNERDVTFSAISERKSGYIDFEDFIHERSEGFVGRRSIFLRFESFLGEYSKGYYMVYGKPGMGKSALMSRLTLKYMAAHHFINSDRDGRNASVDIVNNLTHRLNQKYGLEYTASDERTLTELLRLVSQKLKLGDKCIIVIDGVDELEEFETLKNDSSKNLFGLPRILPQNIYVVFSIREITDLPLQSEDLHYCELHPESQENEEDVREYIQEHTRNDSIKKFMLKNSSSKLEFQSTMFEKSEGNFMYLHCVLPQIAKGYYQSFNLSKIPKGLAAYYEDHWDRMKGTDQEAWVNHKLPIIMILTLSEMSLSIEMIKAYAKLQKASQVIEILEGWRQFFYKRDVGIDIAGIKIYKLYHRSFKDFLKNKDLVKIEKEEFNRFIKDFIIEKQQHINEYDRMIALLKMHKEMIEKGQIPE